MFQKILKKIFRKKSFSNSLFNWKQLKLEDLKSYPDGLNHMRSNDLDGMLIKNVLSTSECNNIIENFNKIPIVDKIVMPEGLTFPPVFPQLVRGMKGDVNFKIEEGKFETYFDKCKKYNNNFKNDFKVDVLNKIEMIFKSISGGRSIKIPKGFKGLGEYPFSTVRKLLPQKGNISIHCGNYFQQEFPEFYSHLTEQVEVKDQLSYFILLEEPEKNGELTLFDIKWEDGQTKVHPSENSKIFQPDGNELNINKLGTMKIIPKKGDMIIFQGGALWHRVEQVMGKNSRYTLGGFMGFSKKDTHYYIWS